MSIIYVQDIIILGGDHQEYQRTDWKVKWWGGGGWRPCKGCWGPRTL